MKECHNHYWRAFVFISKPYLKFEWCSACGVVRLEKEEGIKKVTKHYVPDGVKKKYHEHTRKSFKRWRKKGKN